MFGWLLKFFDLFRKGGEPVTGHEEPTEKYHISEGWLHGENVVRLPSVRKSPMSIDAPVGIVWHYTATAIGTAKSLAKRIQKYDAKKDRPASWHFLVGSDGTIYQSVSCLEGAWHCKGSIEYAGNSFRVNGCTIGIELEGYGKTFTDEQEQAAIDLARTLSEEYHIPTDGLKLKHSQFDPKRRSDPGPVWSQILEENFPKETEDSVGRN